MKLITYRIFSFLLLPMAILFGMAVLMLLSTAFANPVMLLPMFLIACITIYSFSSLRFLIKGIDGKNLLRRSLKDWIRVNAFASIVFVVMMISQCILFLLHPEMMQEILEQAKQMQGTEFDMSPAGLESYLRITSYFFLAYAIVLFMHIIMSFQYLKTYSYLFQDKNS